jgi:hypothetical protein
MNGGIDCTASRISTASSGATNSPSVSVSRTFTRPHQCLPRRPSSSLGSGTSSVLLSGRTTKITLKMKNTSDTMPCAVISGSVMADNAAVVLDDVASSTISAAVVDKAFIFFFFFLKKVPI